MDTHTGEAQTWFPGRRCFCEELVFVPGPNAETQEDDGYLLGLVYNAAKHKSFLAVSLLLQTLGATHVHAGLASVVIVTSGGTSLMVCQASLHMHTVLIAGRPARSSSQTSWHELVKATVVS